MEIDNGTNSTKVTAETVMSIMQHLDMPTNVAFKMTDFEQELLKFASQHSNVSPNLLLNANLNADDWAQLERYINAFNIDYANRIELLKKRLEVTIDSFVWSERVQKVEHEIRQLCDASDFKQKFCPVNADQLLAADSELLFVTKTSSDQVRQKTKVKEVCDFKMKSDVVPDRGGRTEQMTPVQRESFQQQEIQRTQQQQGFRGGDRRGGGDYQQTRNRGDGGGGHRGGSGGHWNQQRGQGGGSGSFSHKKGK